MSIKTLGAVAIAALVVGLTIALAVVIRGRRAAALRADAAEARADTTKLVAGAWERRAEQVELERSALDKALKAKPKVVFRTVVKFDTVRIDSATGGPVTEAAGVRRGSIRVEQDTAWLRQGIGTFATDAEMPTPPGNMKLLNTRIGISPLPIIPRVSCSDLAVDGIRRAHVALDSLPRWVRVEIHDAKADPDVCNQSKGISLGFKVPWWTNAISAGLGALVALAVTK